MIEPKSLTPDFVMGQLRLALTAVLAYGGGKGWFTPTDAGLIMGVATALGPIALPWIWSIASNIGKVSIKSNSAAAVVAKVEATDVPSAIAGATSAMTAVANKAGVIVSLIALAGLLTFGTAHTATKTPLPKPSPLTAIKQFTVDDLTAAAADATANGDYSADCWNALIPLVQAQADTLALPTSIGAAQLLQKARDLDRKVTAGIPDAIKKTCGPVLWDAQQTLLKLGIQTGAAFVPGGGLLSNILK